MTVEFTSGAYFRSYRPLQLSSDLPLHRNVFWKLQGSGHPSAKHFKMVLARRGLNGPPELGCLNLEPPSTLLFPFRAVFSLCALQSLPSGKSVLLGDFEAGQGVMLQPNVPFPSLLLVPTLDRGTAAQRGTIVYGSAFSLSCLMFRQCF